jgi:hypothetical protein
MQSRSAQSLWADTCRTGEIAKCVVFACASAPGLVTSKLGMLSACKQLRLLAGFDGVCGICFHLFYI